MAHRFPQGLRSTQRPKHSRSEGDLVGGPTGFDRAAPRPATIEQQDGITFTRSRQNPHPLAKRFTKFTTNYTGQIKIPKNLIHPDRAVRDGKAFLDVGQIPED